MIKTLGKFFSQAVCRVRHGDGVIRISINYPTVEPSNEDNNNNNNNTKKTKPKVSRQDMRDVVIRIGVNYQSAQPS